MKCLFTVVFLAAPLCVYSQYRNFADVECGLPGMVGSPRIIGGEDAVPGEFPWLVSLRYYDEDYCGATILNDRWIVTAAHCLYITRPLFEYEVFAATGLHNRSEAPAQTLSISRFIIHPLYENVSFTYDIALLETETPIEWADNVGPACVTEDNGEDYAGLDAVVAGWGALGEDEETAGYPDILQKVTVRVISNEECERWYLQGGVEETRPDNQMCAGYEEGGKDHCVGDSGGPLVLDEGNRKMLIGIVSSAIGCARPNLPGIYTRVSSFVDWIEENITQ